MPLGWTADPRQKPSQGDRQGAGKPQWHRREIAMGMPPHLLPRHRVTVQSHPTWPAAGTRRLVWGEQPPSAVTCGPMLQNSQFKREIALPLYKKSNTSTKGKKKKITPKHAPLSIKSRCRYSFWLWVPFPSLQLVWYVTIVFSCFLKSSSFHPVLVWTPQTITEADHTVYGGSIQTDFVIRAGRVNNLKHTHKETFFNPPD